jgi:hypothetical protein
VYRLLLILLLLHPVFSFSQKGVTNYFAIRKDTSEPRVFFKKEYFFNHSNQQYQSVVRNYFGVQQDMLSTFKNNDIRESFNSTDFTKFNMASFFSESSYELSAEKTAQAKIYFKPIIDSIFYTAQHDSNLHAEILVLGYCNETETNLDDFNKEVLSQKIKKTVSTNIEIRNAISYLRAKAISDLIEQLVEKNNYEFQNYQKVLLDVIAHGRATSLPELNRTYQAHDEKRRIAKIYWRLRLP